MADLNVLFRALTNIFTMPITLYGFTFTVLGMIAWFMLVSFAFTIIYIIFG